MAVEATARSQQNEVLLEVRNLVKHFPIRQGIIFTKQVNGTSCGRYQLHGEKGETLGLVRERLR